jgi:hypothetical protein
VLEEALFALMTAFKVDMNRAAAPTVPDGEIQSP